MMIDDLDGALEMDDDGPLMEITYGDGPLMTLMMCLFGARDDVALGDGFGALALDGGAPWSN